MPWRSVFEPEVVLDKMTQLILDHLFEALSGGMLTLLAFLVNRLIGRFDSLESRAHGHTTAIAVIKNELGAVWRALDPPRRFSDHANGEDEE